MIGSGKMATLVRSLGFKTNLAKRVSSARGKCDLSVVMTDDSSVVVCWHPEKTFAYDMSRPIDKETKPTSDSVLKVQSSKELMSILKPKKPEFVRQELMAMTHTLKHIWFPPKFQFRRKKKIEMDRPYL